ncbi:serine/threonine-protein kinase pim-1-like [Tachysurus ichikawai]
MHQVVQAACHCCGCGVFHGDIKAENLLINTDTLDVKLKIFGCGDLLKDTPIQDMQALGLSALLSGYVRDGIWAVLL